MSTKEEMAAAKAVRDPIYKRINADLDLLRDSFRGYTYGDATDEYARGRTMAHLDASRAAISSLEIWGEDIALAPPKPAPLAIVEPEAAP
jgi:hypothetical protein